MKQPMFTFKAAGALAFATLAGVSDAALAQRSEQRSGLEEIVVTAQRREQNLQDVPISVSAVTADSLTTMGVEEIGDLSGVSPGLTMLRQTSSTMPYLRGIGATTAIGGQESPVSLYVDGFYVPQLPALNFSFNNIQRVEVIKGPQGTLFGRNATGGLIQIITRDPSPDAELRTNVSFDDYQTIEAQMYGTTGVTDALATDLALVYTNQSEGYGENLVYDDDVGRRRERGLRNTWLLDAEDTKVRLSLDAMDVWSDIGIARQAGPGTRTLDGQGPPSEYWDIRAEYRPSYDVKGYGAGLKVTHDLGSMQLVSLTSARYGKSRTRTDQDATPSFITRIYQTDENTTYTQELQLVSDDDQSALSWIVGVYLFRYDVDFDIRIFSPAAPLAPLGGGYDDFSSFDTRSYAGFAQGTYAFTDRTNLTLGFRYTADRREFDGHRETFSGLGSRDVPRSKDDSEEPSWRVSLDHRFSEELMMFASYNRGFKSGIYNTTNIDAPPVKAEKLDAYEVGIKTDLFDRQVRVNASGFYYDYQDFQVLTITSLGASLNNAPKAEIYGAELEITATPTNNLNLTLGLGWLESEYKDFPGATISEPRPAPLGGNYACISGQTVASTNCPESVRPRLAGQTAEGNELSRAPGFTASLSGRYAIPTSLGEFAVGGSITHTGSFYWEADNRAKQDAIDMINARLEWVHPSDNYRVYLFGRNLADEEFTQYLGGGTSGDLEAPQPPRTFGIGAELKIQ